MRSSYSLFPIPSSLALIAVLAVGANAQDRGSAALAPALASLGVNARVLVIAAHPDDEDTNLITYLARGRHVTTAYLSLTRGDGGQNLIGNELGEALGAIRTEELLAARRIDGGFQYFTRAYDYGFSKNVREAFTQWPKDSILRDVITVVRAFRPHVIVSVFTGTPRDGHGHHQAAGILAREAYDLSADTVRFPRALTAGNGAWTVSKFYRSASFRPADATLTYNAGEYDPVRGRSYAEIAAESRSQHRSQGFGALQRRGVRLGNLQREATRVPAPNDAATERSLFDGIDTTWARFRGVVTAPDARVALDSLPQAFVAARESFDAFQPHRSIPALARVQSLLRRICGEASETNPCASLAADGRTLVVRNGDLLSAMEHASARTEQALALAAGVAVEAAVPREMWATNTEIPVDVAVFNRGRVPVRWVRTVLLPSADAGGAVAMKAVPRLLAADSAGRDTLQTKIFGPTRPWWLAVPRRGAVFGVAGSQASEGSRRGPVIVASFEVEGATFGVFAPVVHRFADPTRGDVSNPVAAAPAVSLTLDREVAYAQASTPIERPIRVHVRSASAEPREVTLSLELPPGLVADSAQRVIMLPGIARPSAADGSPISQILGQTSQLQAGEVRTVTFQVRGQLRPGRHTIRAVATSGNERFSTGYAEVAYEHIRTQRLYRSASLDLEAVDVRVPRGMTVAYIQGVGDNSALMLEQLGVAVTMLDPANIANVDLSKYSTVVVGPRAYEASGVLAANNPRLLEYVRNGGTMVVQYGQYEMMQPGMMPYPVTINRPHDRVTIEEAPVTIVDPTAQILNAPNRITDTDFVNWVQDRSLYMPRTFDSTYAAPLEMHDPGEAENRGALLVAPYGRGTYVYTSLAFFRQLPSGVPGAARLFVNLLAAQAPRRVQ